MKKLKDCTENDVRKAWGAIRAKKPLIFHITNDVAASLQANVCLAVGASPLMSRHPAETEELVAISDGFLANLGTPTADSIEAVTLGLAAAGRAGRMTLLDPVGYGASRLRCELFDGILKDHSLSILKGNAGEISLMAGAGGATRGVDVAEAGDLRSGVMRLARDRGCVVCATGPEDLIGDGTAVAVVRGGSDLLPFVSGSGCVAGTVVLAAAAACGSPVLGALCGLLAMGIVSERAEKAAGGSASFAVSLGDALHRLEPGDFAGAAARWSLEVPR